MGDSSGNGTGDGHGAFRQVAFGQVLIETNESAPDGNGYKPTPLSVWEPTGRAQDVYFLMQVGDGGWDD